MEHGTRGARSLRQILRALAVAVLAAPIRLYRLCISPLLPPSCRFHPTCSCYALEALSVHGPFYGSWLTLRRLARCHPIAMLGGGSGFDPVPDPAHSHARPR